jgi:hypothetical protein
VKINAVLSGDRNRRRLFDAVSQTYFEYNAISRVPPYFERNLAKAIKRAPREPTRCPLRHMRARS